MSEAQKREHEEQLLTSDDKTLTLARFLQRMAFKNEPARLEKDFQGYFKPAPMYMRQAISITEDESMTIMIKKILDF
tara:strand:+ start:319 stop:549 length:231 start_codon:yes stop_codon:yes gene_type:complete